MFFPTERLLWHCLGQYFGRDLTIFAPKGNFGNRLAVVGSTTENMVRATLLLSVLVILAMPAIAQEHKTPAAGPEVVPQDGKDEVRATAGALKEMLGQVHEQLASTRKLTSVAKADQKATLDQAQEVLMSAQADIESSLTEVSNAGPDGWKVAKTKADAALAKAKEAINLSKKASSTAVN